MEHVTNDLNPDDPEPSVVDLVDTVSGFPEIKYWYDYEFCTNISPSNKAILCPDNAPVTFYRDPSNATANFEYLFNITSEGDKFADPHESSLYNITTLKELLDIGERTPNLMKE